MVSRLSAGRKIFDLLQLALEVGEEGEQLLACVAGGDFCGIANGSAPPVASLNHS